ncbi:hypothetical protein ACK8HX_04870 [Oryzobacter sp. R7]|uniref:hypothetical protein n=1 Tax=Oryzobacter faecalis TaxID=3388656 RepID=UPI00398C9FB0
MSAVIRRGGLALAIAGVMALATVTPSRASESVLTVEQQQTVYEAMVRDGMDPAVALEESRGEHADVYPVRYTEEVDASEPQKVQNREVPGARVGGTCTGYTRAIAHTKTAYTVYGAALFWHRLSVYWCYNHKAVTAAWSTRSQSTSTFASVGGWYFDKYTEYSENLYTYNGRVNGGAAFVSEGLWRACASRGVGCWSARSLRPRVYAHYDGSYSAY